MKTIVAALAVLSLSGTMAHAQSNVTLFGVMDLGFVYESGGPAGSTKKITSGVAGGSRFGVRGTEDLGGGLAGVFWLEMGILGDTGALGQGGLAWGRQAFVGLRGPFGSVNLGRQYTPAALTQVEFDPFTTGLAGTSANLLSPGGAGGSNRMNNTLKYNTPGNLGGFNAEVAYAFGEVAGNSLANREIGFSAGYAAGPLSFKAAYHNVNDAAGNSAKVSWLAGKYDFGVAAAFANVVVHKGARVFGIVNADSRDLLLGLTAPVAGGKFMASYITKNDRTAADRDAKQWALGYDYFLSKRTDVYASVAHIRNQNAPIVVGVSGFRVGNATEQGTGNRAVNIGIRHAF